MKYTGTGTRMGHKLFIRKRHTAFDDSKPVVKSFFGTCEDHKEIKTAEYAAFQKNQFAKKRREKRIRNIILIGSEVLAIATVLLLFYVFNHLLGPLDTPF